MKRVMMLIMVIGMMVSMQANVFGSLEGTVFQMVDNFETHANNATIDNKTCPGTLGGTWDTEGDGTANMKVGGVFGTNQYLVAQGRSDGSDRGAGFMGLTNPIGSAVFFRFYVTTEAKPVQTYLGMHDYTSTSFLNNPAVPSQINAGFVLYRPTGTSGNIEIRTIDAATTLKADLVAGQWYNAWIAANNATDTFDLYIHAVTAPGGASELPTDSDKIGTDLSFSRATDNDLTGLMLCTRDAGGSPQIAEMRVDDIYWAVPEPTTLILLGLGGLALIRKR